MVNIREKHWTNKKIWLLIIISSLFVAIVSHFYFINQKSDGILMTGFNDGLSQMIPFKKFIYDEYTSGNFFYSDSFGLGGGFYSQLGYYYSTNLFFLFHVVIIYLLEMIGLIEHPDITFWANAILPMSIFKLTLVLIVTTYFFRQIKFGFIASFLGAIIYALNVLYFRHTMYWDFFSDAFIWFILLLIGIEKVIQQKSGKLFVIAIACNMITNFYFSYVNLLLAILYIFLRIMIPFFKNEMNVSKQLITFTYLGLIGALISSFAFIPAVAGYMNNFRPEYMDPIPIFSLTDNILFNSRVIFLPIFIVIILCSWRFYKHSIFRFFATIAVVGTILHFVPLVGSMFNGFSAPQNRWEHIIGLAYGGVTAFTIQHIKQLKHLGIGLGVYCLVSCLILWLDNFSFTKPVHFIIPLLSLMIIVILFLMKRWTLGKQKRVFFISVALFMIVVANTFQATRLMIPPKNKVLASESIMASEHYNSVEQQDLVRAIEIEKETPYSRLDWMVPTRNNTPIVQDYKGFSIYSSILNRNLLLFYYDKLQITMEEESVSWYDGMGDRANLLSLLNGQFYMRDKEANEKPYGFQEVLESEHYRVYENQWLLPSFRKTNNLYTEESLQDQSILAREQAMLKGAIVSNVAGKEHHAKLNKIYNYDTELISATYDGKHLIIEEEYGGILININESIDYGDLYLSFYIEGIKKHSKFLMEINEFQTIRSESESIYRTGFNDLTVRVKVNDQIYIKLPKGKYKIRDIKIFHEDYQTLREAYEKYSEDEPLSVEWEDGYLKGNVISENKGEILVTPIPYEEGWKLEVNGEAVPIEKVNYAFIGIPLEYGGNNIEMIYRPPYFNLSISLTFFGLSIFAFFLYTENVKKIQSYKS